MEEVIFTRHFIEKAVLKGVFDRCGFENGKNITEEALKGTGLIVRDGCDFKCIYEVGGRIATVPFVRKNGLIIAKTIYPSQQPDKDIYEKFKIEKSNIR